MKRREGEYLPSPRALAYTLTEGATVHLLPVDGSVTIPCLRRIEALYEEASKAEGAADLMVEGHDTRARIVFASLLAFAAWDAAEFEWEHKGEPDDALFLEGVDLVTAAESCRRELLQPSTLRLGIGPSLITAALRSIAGREGLTDEDPAPGEGSPAAS